MGYYVRALCKAREVPSIVAIVDRLRDHGFAVEAKPRDPAELNSPHWAQFELVYEPGKLPIPVECYRDTDDDSLVPEEVSEFLDEIAEVNDSPGKIKVREHLKATHTIISCQLLSDVDDHGYRANDAFLDLLCKDCDGMVYADLEGFYDGQTLVLSVR